jgi:hypothetical protein
MLGRGAIGLVLFVAFAVMLVLLAVRTAAKRRAELLALSAELGLTFAEGDPFDIPDSYKRFDWLTEGENQKACNVLYGQIGSLGVKAFDYSYETEDSDDHHTTHSFSAIIVDTNAVFPTLLIRPEGLFDRVAGTLGFNDTDFESDEFSRRFYVSSDNKKFAYDVVHPLMMDFLIADPVWQVQMLGPGLMVYKGGSFSSDEFRQGIKFVQAFVDHIPEYLWQALPGSESKP